VTKKTAAASSERRLEYLSLDELVPALKNPKRHSDAIDASMTRFGFTEPVILDERTGRLVAGHGRVAALRKLHQQGHAAPEGVRTKAGQAEGEGFDDGEWLIPVLRGWASKTDADAEAYLVASNRLTEAGGWDDAALAEMLQGLQASDSLLGVGFSEADLDALMSRTTPEGEGTNAFQEWQGMPAFANENHVFRKIVLNFATQADVDSFAALLGQEITEKTRSMWHPYQPPRDLAALRYAEDGIEEDEAADE